MKYFAIWLNVLILIFSLIPQARAADMGVHNGNRYYTDSIGKAVFLLGYHAWASVDPNGSVDHPSYYSDMINRSGDNGMNYIRISLGINYLNPACGHFTSSGDINPAPFRYINCKADLDAWDTTFWSGLKTLVQQAKSKGVFVHITIFDGVDIRSCSEDYRWSNSFWNVDNQIKSYYGDLDVNGDCSADQNGDFYRRTDFMNSTGVGKYQKLLIDKAISETASFDNVFFEVGNEVYGAPQDWYSEVVKYVQSKTGRPISVNPNSTSQTPSNTDGYAQHKADTPSQVKSNVASITGKGYPAWEDPDGPDLISGSADDLRRAAWYALAGGAAGWGGFSTDWWTSTVSSTKTTYYKNVMSFINAKNLPLGNMGPNHSLIGNSAENSLLAETGKVYVGYVLNDSTVTVNLSALSGNATSQLYNPKTGTFTTATTVQGGGTRTFTKPSGADDWVVYVVGGGSVGTPVPTIPPSVSPSGSPSVTSAPGATSLGLILLLHGIGKGGDNVNANSGGNSNPLRSQRQVTVEILNASSQVVATKQGSVTYGSTAGNFTGTVDLGTLGSGNYLIRVKVQQYLSRSVSGIVRLKSGQVNNIPAVTLVTGDSNNDNQLSILDYNVILDCFADFGQPKNCADTAKKQNADLTDDGNVNQFDYNLFIRELSVQQGQ